MKDVLTTIIAAKRLEVERHKASLPASDLLQMVADMPKLPHRSMREALQNSASGVIAEFKRRSPSKGWINQAARPELIVPAYEAAGAAALSILTDEEFFGGTLSDIERVRKEISIPIIRKEFIVDEYQLLQAKLVGADAVLLIAAALEVDECNALMHKAKELELEVLLELHSEAELEYVGDDVDMVGINNRNLGTFHTDVANSYRMIDKLPTSVVKVSESGIYAPATVRELRDAGFRGFLIGENFMRTANPGATLREFVEEVER